MDNNEKERLFDRYTQQIQTTEEKIDSSQCTVRNFESLHSLNYYYSIHKEQVMDTLLSFGKDSCLSNMAEEIRQESHKNVRTFQPIVEQTQTNVRQEQESLEEDLRTLSEKRRTVDY